MTLFNPDEIECMGTYLDNHTFRDWNYENPKIPLRILCVIANDFRATTDQLRKKLDITTRSLEHYINSLRRDGLVKEHPYPYEITHECIDILNTLHRVARDSKKYGL